jgi:hypothetical protein
LIHFYTIFLPLPLVNGAARAHRQGPRRLHIRSAPAACELRKDAIGRDQRLSAMRAPAFLAVAKALATVRLEVLAI